VRFEPSATISGMDYRIIPYEDKYLEQVKDLIGNLLVFTGTLSLTDLPIDDEDLDAIPETYSGKGGFWIAVQDDQVIGTVGLKDMGENIAKLKRMFVVSDLHGKGVGEALLNYALNHAKAQGFTKIILNTNEHMTRAHHFYEKHGFEHSGKTGTQLHYELSLS